MFWGGRRRRRSREAASGSSDMVRSTGVGGAEEGGDRREH